MSDNFESYFKKYLSDETTGNEDWNVPSDEVWEKVLPVIQKEKGFFIPWRYLYIAVITLIVVFAFFIYKWDSMPEIVPVTIEFIDSENEAITQQEIPVSTKPTNTINWEGNKTNNQNKIQNEGKGSIEIMTDSQKKNNDPIHKNTETLKPNKEKKIANKIIASVKDEIITDDPVFENHLKNQEKITEKPKLKIIDNPIARTDTILEQHAKDKSDGPQVVNGPNLIEINPESPKGKIGFGIYFLPTYNSTYVSGNMVSSKMEAGNTFLFSGNYGIDIKYYLSDRIVITSGIQRTEIKSWSKSSIGFAYDSSREHNMGNGEIENTSEVPLITPFGEIGTMITYRFPDFNNLPDGELMESNFETHQAILYVSISLGIEYNIVASRKINWFGEGGMLLNQSVNNATNFSSRVIHDGSDMKVMSEEMKNKPNYKDRFLNYYIGTGLSYNLSNSFQLSGSARYFDNLSKVNLQENMSTHLNGFSLKIGLIYFY